VVILFSLPRRIALLCTDQAFFAQMTAACFSMPQDEEKAPSSMDGGAFDQLRAIS